MNKNARFYTLLAVLAAVIGVVVLVTLNRPREDLESAAIQGAHSPASRIRSEEAPPRHSGTPSRKAQSTPPVTAQSITQSRSNRNDIGVITGTVTSTDVSIPATIQIDLYIIDWKRHETPKTDSLVNSLVMDSDAEFEFAGLKFAQYFLHAHGDGVTGDTSRTLTLERPEQAVTIDLQQSGIITGRVTDLTDRPIEGARVYVSAYRLSGGSPVNVSVGRASYSKVFTDADGDYLLDTVQVRPATPLQYKIAAAADGFATQFSGFASAGDTDVDFVLGQGGSVSGTVVEAGTRFPFPNVTVTVGSAGPLDRMDMQTDVEGRFYFASLSPGETELRIVDDHLVSTDESMKIMIEEGTELEDITLEAAMGGIISGRLYDVDTDGGLANEVIRVSPQGFKMYGEPTQKTDGRGNYAFTGLTSGTYEVQRGNVYGYPIENARSRKRVTAKLGDEVAGIDFALSKGLRISGVVVDDKDSPVSEVSVTAQATEGGGYGYGRTRRDGGFILAGLNPGKYNVRARKEGVSAPPLGPYELLDEGVSGLRFVLEPEASIEGVVVDEQGRPVKDIQVYARLDTPQGYFGIPSKKSDLRGAFRVGGLTEGTYRFAFGRNGGFTFSEATDTNPHVEVKSGETVRNVRLVLTLQDDMSISGRVTDTTGKPISRARIQASGPAWGNTQTDARGYYTVLGLKEGMYTLSARRADRTTQELSGVAANSSDANFVLRGRGRIEGQVLNVATREPITDFSIKQNNNSQLLIRYLNDFTVIHDSEGRFSLDGADEGSATVVARADGYAEGTYEVSGIIANRTSSDVVIYLEPGATLEGIVVTSAGEPVRNAMIFDGPVPRSSRERAMKTQSGSDGTFSLESLTPGDLTVSAYHPEFAPSSTTVYVSASTTTYAEIVLRHGGTLEGRVTMGGLAAAKASVSVNSLQGGRNRRASTDEDGYYEIKGLPDGTAVVYSNMTLGGSNRNKSTQAELEDDQVTVVNFDFSSATASVEGTVTRDGVPQSSATIITSVQSPDGAESSYTETDADGHYLLEGMPAGAVTLRVQNVSSPSIMRTYSLELSDGEHLRRDIELASGTAVQCILSNLPADALQPGVWALRGEVTVNLSMEFFQGTLGRLLAGAAQADGDTARIEGLEPGTYTIVAFATVGERDPENPFANMLFTTSPLQIHEGDKEVSVRLAF